MLVPTQDREADQESEIGDTIVCAPRPVQQRPADSARLADSDKPVESAAVFAEGVGIEAEYETLNENPFPTPMATPDPTLATTIHEAQPDTQDSSRPVPIHREIGLDVDEGNILTGRRIRKARRNAFATQRQEDYDSHIADVVNQNAFHIAFAAATSFLQARLHSTQLPAPPNHWGQLKHHRHEEGFLRAAAKEFQDLERKGTFEPVLEKTAAKAFVLLVKWVFTYKLDEDSYLLKYKARLVVRGDLQKNSMFSETYAATLAARIFRFLMALACYFDLEMKQFDAVNAFTNAQLDEKIYIQYPEGFKKPGWDILLLKALYGLRRSPLLWFQDISAKLMKLGFHQIPEAQCLFMKKDLIVFFYVDDICVLYHRDKQDIYQQFRCEIMAEYELREIGDLQWFLGIRVVRDWTIRKIWLCQDAFINKITQRFQINGPQAKTPMATEELLPFEGTAAPQEIHDYQQRIGCCNYSATITRPDTAQAASKLSEFLTNPGLEHHRAAARLLSYLSGTATLALELGVSHEDPYSGESIVLPEGVEPPGIRPESGKDPGPSLRIVRGTQKLLETATDASFADHPDRKSTQGFLFKLFGGSVDWKSNKSRTNARSITESELLAASDAATQLIWWKRLFKQVELELNEDSTISCDNLQTVRLMNQSSIKLVTKLRHVDIHGHWLREQVQLGNIKIIWVSTSQMIADGFTKPLPKQKHDTFWKQLNLVDIAHLIRNF